MAKKIFGILCATLFAFTAFGCSTGAESVSFDNDKPWQAAGYEYCKYSVVKTSVGGDKEVVVATGEYETILDTDRDTTTVATSFNLTYNDAAETLSQNENMSYVVNAGLTDRGESEVVFNKNTLVPTSAKKSFTLAQRALCNDSDGKPLALTHNGRNTWDDSYTLPYDVMYGDPRGYSYSVDYSANKATVVTETGKTQKDGLEYVRSYDKVEKEITLNDSTRYDNEQLNYVVRAMSDVKSGGSGKFYLSNIFDSYLNKSYTRYTLDLSCSKDTTDYPFVPSDGFTLTNSSGELKKSDGKYSVPCLTATVQISATNPGPPITMIISSPEVKVAQKNKNQDVTSRKLIMKMTYYEYSFVNVAGATFKTEYTLTDYAIFK